MGKETFCNVYAAPDRAAAKAGLDDRYALVQSYDIPELNTFARTGARTPGARRGT